MDHSLAWPTQWAVRPAVEASLAPAKVQSDTAQDHDGWKITTTLAADLHELMF